MVDVEDVPDAEELRPVQKNTYIPRANHIACEPEQFVVMYQLKGSPRVYSNDEFPLDNVDPRKIGKTFTAVESVSVTSGSDSSSSGGKASVAKKLNKKPTTHPRNSQRQTPAKKPVLQKVNFVKGLSSEEEKASFENMSNVDFVQQQRSKLVNSTASTSKASQSKYVRHHKDRRTCFACGEIGHVSYKCPNSSKNTHHAFA